MRPTRMAKGRSISGSPLPPGDVALSLPRCLIPGARCNTCVAANWRMRLAVGYCFRRQDFPWMTIWEENRSRQSTPWNGRTQARGMEFGTTPFPLGSEENFRRGAFI